VVSVEPSKLQSVYKKLSSSYEDAEEQAGEVSDHIDRVEDVSQAKYAELIKAMRRAESRMAPVLSAFKDNVLFLKHNLNTQAITSLKSELNGIQNNVGTLIREMEVSIAESQDFIRDMELI
jgi:septation ring formation regulator EzrA